MFIDHDLAVERGRCESVQTFGSVYDVFEVLCMKDRISEYEKKNVIRE